MNCPIRDTVGLQYWVEILNPPVDPDFCPLARSVLELKEMVEEHVVFSKKDIIQGLGRIDLGNMSWWPLTTPTNMGSRNSSDAGGWEACVTIPPSFGSIPERRHTTGPSTRPQMEDQLIGQDASLIEVATQTASATVPGVKMTSLITLPDQMEEDRWYVSVVTTSIRRLNLEMTGIVLGDTVTAPPSGSAFKNPHTTAVLSGRVISHQGSTVKELDAE